MKKVVLDQRSILRYLEKMFEYSHPSSAWATICNNALVDAAIEDGHTNIISGLGSDEVFANYDKALNYYFRVRDYISAHNSGETNLLETVENVESILFPGVADFFNLQGLLKHLDSSINTDFISEDIKQFYQSCGPLNCNTHLFSIIVSHECHFRIPDLLLRNFSIHPQQQGACIHYPFLNKSFVEHACSLYPKERFLFLDSKWHSKVTMKQIVANKLPKEILNRKRGTFDFPFSEWLKQGDFHSLVSHRLETSKIWSSGLFKPTTLKHYLRMMDKNMKNTKIKNWQWSNELWVLLTLAAWYDRHISQQHD